MKHSFKKIALKPSPINVFSAGIGKVSLLDLITMRLGSINIKERLMQDTFVAFDLNADTIEAEGKRIFSTLTQSYSSNVYNSLIANTILMPIDYTKGWAPKAPFDFICTAFYLEDLNDNTFSILSEQLK